ncbi:EAL domain-containing protein [Aquibium oceanicum]|uniref:GGDEF domain-containing protein n=1 Tax=Aquibium oceanicum TaxID=1670800 RepID=A0A1L3SPF4_9HYPH|nr:EAL domain-containing protein [Aquibium oceanicum]APH71284.1 hypothetical protein BSQ44_07765 [Aquibium oceanicum]
MAKKRDSSGGERSVWQHALEQARLGMWDWNIQTGECSYSDTWFRMLGYEPGELASTSDLWLTLVHPDDKDEAIASGDRHIKGECDAVETELRLRHKDGHWIWVLDRGGIVERDQDGNPVRMIGVQTDITRQKAAEASLAEVNERTRLALAASASGIWHFDIATRQSDWDPRTRQIFGLEPGTGPLPQATWHGFLHPDDREEAERKHLDPALFDHGSMEMRYRIVRGDGEVRYIETLAKFSPEPAPLGSIVGTVRDVTDEVAADEALRTEKERLRITLKAIRDAVLSTDVDDRITFVNPAACALLDRSEEELVGLRRREAFRAVEGLEEIASGATVSGELVTLHRRDGERFVRFSASPILCSAKRDSGVVYTLQDFTSEHRKQQELAYAALHDPLTGSLNRAAFDTVLSDSVAEASEHPFALLYIDLDYFKALNDFAGHAAGDAALVRIADAIRHCLPPNAAVARLGGDEFAALFATRSLKEAEWCAECILSAIRTADLGVHAGYRQLGASIGIVMVRESGLGAADVLAHADDTCYAAKSAGRNRYMVFSEDTGRLSTSLTAARIVGDIADAMDEDRLVLFGQEIRLLSDPMRSIGKVEVLVRLVNREGRMLSPCEFIPAAERFGRASSLDRWIIRNALSRFGGVMAAGALDLGFNLSAQTLSDPKLWAFVEDTVRATGAPFSRIVFEITETAAVTNFEAAERFVSRARANGCRVSLDDFGAGLSSFDYLRRFPIDSLKIDGSFIQNLTSSEYDRQIVTSINRIAQGLGYDLVAERIENVATLEVLAGMGIKHGQGYLFHRPEPLEAIVERIEAGRAPRSSRLATAS